MLSTKTITSAPTIVADANQKRKQLRITVKTGNPVAFAYGPTASTELTFTTGDNVNPTETVVLSGPEASFAVYGITESGNATVSYEEFFI